MLEERGSRSAKGSLDNGAGDTVLVGTRSSDADVGLVCCSDKVPPAESLLKSIPYSCNRSSDDRAKTAECAEKPPFAAAAVMGGIAFWPANGFSAIMAVNGFLLPFKLLVLSSGRLRRSPPYNSASWGRVDVEGGFGRPT